MDMANADVTTIIAKAILDALGLAAEASRDEVLAAAKRLEQKPRADLTTSETAQIDALRRAVGAKSGASADEVLSALAEKMPVESDNALGRIAVQLGLSANTSAEEVLAKAREFAARPRKIR